MAMTRTEPLMYGYARASADDHKLDVQIEALKGYGVSPDHIFFDDAVGAHISARPGLKRAVTALRPGAQFVVWKIDRLGRNLSELIQTADLLRRKGADLVSLSDKIDTSKDIGKAMYHMVGVFAQLERDMIVERTKAGVAAAKIRGKGPGRRSPLTIEKRAEIVAHMRNGLSFEQIAPLVGLSKSTLYNHAEDLRAALAVLEADQLCSN